MARRNRSHYPKIGVKLAILIVLGGLLGMGNARQRRTGEVVPRAVFALIGILSLTAAGSRSCGEPPHLYDLQDDHSA